MMRFSPDHPRSRGVYEYESCDPVYTPGSSPLARGLRNESDYVCGTDRIIPARAGFTSRRPFASPCDPDHPRSRGVYSHLLHNSIRALGSSPLARGLPTRETCARVLEGIIPARAGFTHSVASRARCL